MTITSRDNKTLKYIRKLSSDAKFRDSENLYVAEGIKLFDDALRSNVSIKHIIHTGRRNLSHMPGQNINIVPDDIMRSLSALKDPQDIIFTISFPVPPSPPAQGRWILLDRVQDPGNVGSILRTAEAFGIDGVIITNGCADPFSPKVVRAAMGATFRLPIYFQTSEIKLPIIATGANGEILSSFPKDCVVALGSEGQGISNEILKKAERVIKIPMPGKAESLGVAAAAAIICWEMSIERNCHGSLPTAL